MKKILFIGNSQLGVIYEWFNKNSLLKNCHFWCVPGGWGPFFSIKSNKLILNEKDISKIHSPFTYPIDLSETVNINDYDIVYIAGAGYLGAYKSDYNIMWRGLIHKAIPINNSVIDVLTNRQIECPISEELYERIIANELLHQGCVQLIQLFKDYKCKIYVQQMPLFSYSILSQEDFPLNKIYQIPEHAFEFFSKLRTNALQNLCDEVNANLIEWPIKLLKNDNFFNETYSDHPDCLHTNIEFSQVMYEQILKDILFL